MNNNVSLWIDTVGMIDESIIGEFVAKDMAVTGGTGIIPTRKKRSFAWVGYAAACLCMAALTVFTVVSGVMNGFNILPGSSTALPQGSATPQGTIASPDESTPPETSEDEHLGDYTYSDRHTLSLNFELDPTGQYYTVVSCDNAPTEIVIPRIYMGRYVTAIGDMAFLDHRNLVSITIPDSVRSIGDRAFENCHGIESILLNGMIETIGERAFSSCTSLTDITLGERVSLLGAGAFKSCTALERIDLPESLVTIGAEAFSGCVALEKIDLPIRLREIGANAFEGCELITEVILPDGFESLGKEAFKDCYDIKKLSVPNSIKYISNTSFSDSRYWLYKTVDGVQYVGNSDNECLVAISVQSTLNTTEVRIGEGCKVIAGGFGCEDEKIVSLYIPKSVEYVGEAAFESLSSLEAVTIGAGSLMVEIGDGAFWGCIALRSIALPSIERISDNMFKYCRNLTEFTIPSSVKAIGSGAFESSGIREITVPENTVSVGDRAFAYCANLTSIVLSDGVKHIGGNVFYSSNKLRSIRFPESLESIGAQERVSQDFDDLDCYVYAGCKYLGNESNNYLICIGVYARVPANVTVAPTCRFILNHAFENTQIVTVDLPEGLIGIGGNAFSMCEKLEAVEAPSTLKYIGRGAFSQCVALKELVLPEGFETIEYNAFEGCELNTLTVPASVKKIDSLPINTMVTYGGTKAEWEALMKAAEGDVDEYFAVECSDGKIYHAYEKTPD